MNLDRFTNWYMFWAQVGDAIMLKDSQQRTARKREHLDIRLLTLVVEHDYSRDH